MNMKTKTKIDCNNSCEGSSLVIALFFFMVCALMCAGILFLANSTTSGVSKSLAIAKAQDFEEPEGIPTSTPTSTPDPQHKQESEAIIFVTDKLNYDYGDITKATIDNGGEVTIAKSQNPENLSYEIFSYINNYYNDWFKSKPGYPVIPDEDGNLSLCFTVTVKDMKPVKVLVTMKVVEKYIETYGPPTLFPVKNKTVFPDKNQKINGISFTYLKMTVFSDVEGCDYRREVELIPPEGDVYLIQNKKVSNNYVFVLSKLE